MRLLPNYFKTLGEGPARGMERGEKDAHEVYRTTQSTLTSQSTSTEFRPLSHLLLVSLSHSPYISLSHSPYISLSHSPYISLSHSPYISLSHSPYISLYLSISLSLYLPISLCLYLTLPISPYLTLPLSHLSPVSQCHQQTAITLECTCVW